MKRSIFFILLTVFTFSSTSFVTVNSESFAGFEKSSKVVIYPNPAKTFVRISCSDASIKLKDVAIYSVIGTEMVHYTPSLPTSEIELNLGKLNKGKYIVRVIYTDGTQETETLNKL